MEGDQLQSDHVCTSTNVACSYTRELEQAYPSGQVLFKRMHYIETLCTVTRSYGSLLQQCHGGMHVAWVWLAMHNIVAYSTTNASHHSASSRKLNTPSSTNPVAT